MKNASMPAPTAEYPVLIGDSSIARVRLRIQGVVQGVGFRPFVYALATRMGLSGFVYNDNSGVIVEVEGATAILSTFHRCLRAERPPLANIEQITAIPLPVTGTEGFAIVESQSETLMGNLPSSLSSSQRENTMHTFVSPDLSICDDCLRELFDPTDRRYRYPFINCTNCGPRYTIIQDLPYDRPLTTMASFELCPECQREYCSADNRRFHAQPNACPTCGPQLTFRWSNDRVPNALAQFFAHPDQPIQGEAALWHVQQALIHGGIVAIKGIGGFHLACDATNTHAVTRLRQRKARGDKPFAVMARDLNCALQIAHADAGEIALLTSRERPIVLLKKKAAHPLSAQIAPGCPELGVMLPYSPLHHLLFAPLNVEDGQKDGQGMPKWLVMTSGNFAGEPIVTGNEVALTELSKIADGVLLHNRAILVPCDDSVLRVHAGQPLPMRRSRGYAPLPVKLPFDVPPILAIGGELKNTFCLAHGRHALMSQHIGDLQGLDNLENFGRMVAHMQKLFRIEPEWVACDLHPGYHSTLWAYRYVTEHNGKLQGIKIQHHHAHIAALMAEHTLPAGMPVIGFSFDGTGYGIDGAIWGGEVLVADYEHFERFAHLQYFPLPGGDSAIRHPYRTALAALRAAGIEWDDRLPPVATTTRTERDVLTRQLEVNLNCVPTSSMGRLFDAVATLAGVRQTITYEAQAAIEMEALVDADDRDSYAFTLPTQNTSCFDATPVLKAVVADALANLPPAKIATRFHNAVVKLIVDMSLIVRARTGINHVALSGGVFQNVALLQPTVRRLQSAGFEVLEHHIVPPNDGGLALGQAVIAAAQIQAQSK